MSTPVALRGLSTQAEYILDAREWLVAQSHRVQLIYAGNILKRA